VVRKSNPAKEMRRRFRYTIATFFGTEQWYVSLRRSVNGRIIRQRVTSLFRIEDKLRKEIELKERSGCGSGKENRQRSTGTDPGFGKVSTQGETRKKQATITVTWHLSNTTVIEK
jgi:hypothetical protein